MSDETPEQFAMRVLASREWPCMAPGCGRTTSLMGRSGWTAEVTFWKGIKRVLCPEHSELKEWDRASTEDWAGQGREP